MHHLHPSAEAIRHAVQQQRAYLIDSTARLVAAPSFSGAETSACEAMEALLQAQGLATEHLPMDSESLRNHPLFSCPCNPDNNRYNLLAIHQPPSGISQGRKLLFNGHLDVVPTGPAEMWAQPPFAPYEQDGWLYGRGAGDMKGGLACALTALQTLKAMGLQPASLVGINAVVDEEDTGNGTLASLGALHQARLKARYEAFDTVLIPEPFGETVMAAQIGVCWLTVKITGRPTHVAYMNQGLNPIEAGIQIMQVLKQAQDDLNRPENRHPAFAHVAQPININLGKIEGGEWHSSVPCTCTLGIRASFYPDRDADEAVQWFSQLIRQAAQRINPALHIEIDHRGFKAPGCVYDLEAPAMQALQQAHADMHGAAPRHLACTATTDGRHFRLSTPWAVTNYGPIARNIHGIDEAVDIASMLRVTETFVRYIIDQCKVVPLEGHFRPD